MVFKIRGRRAGGSIVKHLTTMTCRHIPEQWYCSRVGIRLGLHPLFYGENC